MSTLKTINVIHPSGTTNNIVNDASGNVAVGGTLTASTITSASATALTIKSAGTTAMTVDTSQNVGIGTGPGETIGATLEVKGAVGTALRIRSTLNSVEPTSYYTLGRDTDGLLKFNGAQTTFVGYKFFNTGSEVMRIDSSGNLLVARTTNSTNNAAQIAVSFTQNGQVFTPTTNDKYPITFENAAGTTVGYIYTTSSATTYSTSSDYRLKDNVQPMITGLATVSALKPVTYDWKSDGSSSEGFIAHELQSVIPHAVTGEKDAVNKDGSIKPQGVDYSKIVVHLVAAIQEQQTQIEELKARLSKGGL